jgi:hypothetical protein
MFGEMYSVETGMPMLQVGQEFEKVQDTIFVKDQLLILHGRLARAIQELLATLVHDPSSYARRVEYVGLLFRNMQYLLNLLRPLQGARTLEDVLTNRIQEKKDRLDDLAKYM